MIASDGAALPFAGWSLTYGPSTFGKSPTRVSQNVYPTCMIPPGGASGVREFESSQTWRPSGTPGAADGDAAATGSVHQAAMSRTVPETASHRRTLTHTARSAMRFGLTTT